MFGSARRRIRASTYDDWEWYFLIVAAVVSVLIYADVRPVTSLLSSLDTVRIGSGYTFSEVLIAALQGIVVGTIAGRMYARGSVYYRTISGSFRTKERIILVRLCLLTLVGIVVGLVIPDLVYRHAEFVVVQMTGVVLFLGYVFVHAEIVNWNLDDELPVVVASLLLAVVPLLS